MKKLAMRLAAKVVIFVFMLFLVTLATFGLMHAAPGNPYASERRLPPIVEQAIRVKLCLNRPWYVQYGCYIRGIANGTLPSMRLEDKKPYDILFPGHHIADGLPASAFLGIIALTGAVLVGTASGVIAAKRKNTAADYFAMSLAMIGITIPSFVIGPLLSTLAPSFGLPPNGWGAPRHIILPALTLGLGYAAYFARFARTGMLDVINEDYVRTARAKGLPAWLITFRHEMRLGLKQCATFLGPAASGIVIGSLVVEKIFSIPGIGSELVTDALQKDYTMLMAMVVLLFSLLFVANIFVDVAAYYIDPRTRGKE